MKFKYFKPTSIEEALTLKNSYSNSKFVAGGTDVFVLIKKKVINPPILISLRNIPELQGIKNKEDIIVIKSCTTLREIEKSEIIQKHFPALYDALINMASVQIRNVGTIGGNICNASPAADTASPLLIYNAKVKIIDFKLSEKIIDLKDFFTGVKQTKLGENEIVKEFILEKPLSNASSAYYKFMKRKAMDLANVGVAVKLDLDDKNIKDVRIALSTVAPTPIRAFKAEEFLLGKDLSEPILEKAGEIAKNECSPIDDIRGLAWHKREIVKVYVKRVGMKAYERIKSNEQ